MTQLFPLLMLMLTKHSDAVFFVIVGTTTAFVFTSLIFIFEQLGFVSLYASITAYILAVIFQYLGHTIFTYKRRILHQTQLYRFITINLIGLVISVLMIDYITPYAGLSRTISAFTLTLFLPMFNYVFFRFWVFSSSN